MENVCACVLSWKISSFTSFSVSQVFLHSGGLADYQRWWMIWTLLQTRDNAVSRGGTLFNQGHSAGSSLAGRSFMATSRVRSQSPSQHIFHYQQQKGCWGLGEWQPAIRAPAEQELRRQIAESPGLSEEEGDDGVALWSWWDALGAHCWFCCSVSELLVSLYLRRNMGQWSKATFWVLISILHTYSTDSDYKLKTSSW